MNTYNEYYRENVVPALMDALKVRSPMEVPRLKKITLNMGLGSAVSDNQNEEVKVDDNIGQSGYNIPVSKHPMTED